MYQLSDYDFSLPEKQIAQQPCRHRDQSKLLVLNRNSGKTSHHNFYDIADLLEPSDLLVVNNTRVIPGRLYGHKESGGRVELLILDYTGGFQVFQKTRRFECPCLIKASKRPQVGSILWFDMDLKAEVTGFQEGVFQVRFLFSGHFDRILDTIGQVPLPPYIRRETEETGPLDRVAYQTVYAQENGAIAAPTAGLHFTPQLIEKIRLKNIQIVEITLHVGYGTFLPIRVDDIRNHTMHSERYSISQQTADTLNQKKKKNERIIAVGTTAVRTLEYATGSDGFISSGDGLCDLFIYPGFNFKTVNGMITNFHLPKSSLMMLVSAFAGRSRILAAYQEAIDLDYRFFSYGDAMFIA